MASKSAPLRISRKSLLMRSSIIVSSHCHTCTFSRPISKKTLSLPSLPSSKPTQVFTLSMNISSVPAETQIQDGSTASQSIAGSGVRNSRYGEFSLDFLGPPLWKRFRSAFTVLSDGELYDGDLEWKSFLNRISGFESHHGTADRAQETPTRMPQADQETVVQHDEGKDLRVNPCARSW